MGGVARKERVHEGAGGSEKSHFFHNLNPIPYVHGKL